MEAGKKSGSRVKFFILFTVLIGCFLAVRFTPLSDVVRKDVLLAFFSSLKDEWWGPVFFILIYAIGCVFALPGSVLTLIGGAIFGTFYGTLYNVLASNLGASLAFLMARFLGRDFVASLMKGGKLAQLDESIEKNGFATIFRLRLIPVVPFNGLNFGSGFSRVKYRDYFLGSMIGMLPATFIYTYFADALLQGVSGAGKKAFLNLAMAGLLLITISFFPTIYKRFKTKRA